MKFTGLLNMTFTISYETVNILKYKVKNVNLTQKLQPISFTNISVETFKKCLHIGSSTTLKIIVIKNILTVQYKYNEWLLNI